MIDHTPERVFDFTGIRTHGFLTRLELALGLPASSTEAPLRVACYARSIAELEAQQNGGKHFFSASFATDPWRTARKLLSLRDELLLNGWTAGGGEAGGGGATSPPARLAVFAAFERGPAVPGEGSGPPDSGPHQSRPRVPPTHASGIPDRIRRLLSRLECIPSGIETLELADALDSFPLLWRRLFSRLEARGTKVVEWTEPGSGAASPDSGLARAKAALASNQMVSSTPSPIFDSTFLRLEARSLFEAAEATAALLRTHLAQGTSSPFSSSSSSSSSSSPPSSPSILLIRDGDPRTHAILDSALRRHGLAVPGLRLSSTHRPACQVLPLFLQLTWEPVDTTLLVQFLHLPVSPVPGTVRRHLLRALASAPGFGSDDWTTARDKAIASLRENYGDDAATHAETAIRNWLDIPRTPDGTRVPLTRVMDLTRQVAEWLNHRAHPASALTRTSSSPTARRGSSSSSSPSTRSPTSSAPTSRPSFAR